MKPYFESGGVTIYHGDCREILPQLTDRFDACITDPPYGLEFMGKEWDAPWKANWQNGGGFSKPGIGERKTEWPSFSANSRFGAANPTCATCGGRARGGCHCGNALLHPLPGNVGDLCADVVYNGDRPCRRHGRRAGAARVALVRG